jgi:hypothetical protein
MECFEPNAAPEQLFARLEVIGRHATPALYNAVEHRRIPFRFVWMPLAKIQEGLGGKAKAITLLISTAVIALVLAMIFIPYPLKMDATGNLLPETRRWIFSPVEAQVKRIDIPENRQVASDQPVLLLFDHQLGMKVITLEREIEEAKAKQAGILKQLGQLPAGTPQSQRAQLQAEWQQAEATAHWKGLEKAALMRNLHNSNDGPGFFFLNSPKFPDSVPDPQNRRWTVLNTDYRETLRDRPVKPSDPLLRLGDRDGNWEAELKIPQKHVGQVVWAFEQAAKNGQKELDVDILARSEPTTVYKGKLTRLDLSGMAEPNKDDNNESEPVVLAYVRLVGKDLPGGGKDIPDEYSLPKNAPWLLVSNIEVHAKIRCGNHPMGYSLFYGVWEFFYEKVVFFF